MKKLFSIIAAVILAFGLALPSHAGDFSKAQMKKMSTFLSNFTEVGLNDFTAKEVLDPSKPLDMIHFAIRHQWLNNFHKNIKPDHTPYGDVSIDVKYVRESLKRYFDYDLQGTPNVRNPYYEPDCTNCKPFLYYSDGARYYFVAADGEQAYFARVTQAKRLPDGNIQMKGVVYNAEDPSEVMGPFTAIAKPHTWNGKATWAIISLKTQYK
ncbi:MAG: hypothetical protein IK089_03925 [Oxalobacter sp.]|jgi:hypothetical protein|nr:hypothetical protein [Oxalobacter sp.]